MSSNLYFPEVLPDSIAPLPSISGVYQASYAALSLTNYMQDKITLRIYRNSLQTFSVNILDGNMPCTAAHYTYSYHTYIMSIHAGVIG